MYRRGRKHGSPHGAGSWRVLSGRWRKGRWRVEDGAGRRGRNESVLCQERRRERQWSTFTLRVETRRRPHWIGWLLSILAVCLLVEIPVPHLLESFGAGNLHLARIGRTSLAIRLGSRRGLLRRKRKGHPVRRGWLRVVRHCAESGSGSGCARRGGRFTRGRPGFCVWSGHGLLVRLRG